MQANRLLAITVLLFSCTVRAEAQPQGKELNSIERLEYKLEISRHELLYQVVAEYQGRLTEFTTDGCSGGLSVGWEYLATKIARFKEVHGEIPPWQGCCVDHDREYHRGGQVAAEDSFFLRLAADRKLMECVRATGSDRVEELSETYGITAEEVSTLYRVISRLMYRAVRVGGVPCSGLPWRWGYGWPECDVPE